MSRNSTIDYISSTLFNSLGVFFRSLPKSCSLFIGKRFGDLLYYLDARHRAISYANIKVAFGTELCPREVKKLTRRFYHSFGQNIIEIFFVPLVNKKYMDKYITIEGLENAVSAFKKGKGTIFLAVHAGSWELSNIIAANLGFTFNMVVRRQSKFDSIEKILNEHRLQKGCKLIYRQNQTRQIITALKNNEAVGITCDQGGRLGCNVKFFGKDASMATGAIRLSMKYGASIIPAYFVRLNGAHIKLILGAELSIRKTDDVRSDIKDNLQGAINLFEKLIKKYPQEYLWTYKIWKYGRQRNILVLNDGKAGHLRQAQAAANIIKGYLREKGLIPRIEYRQVEFKNKISRMFLAFCAFVSGRFSCQGCLWCMNNLLSALSYAELAGSSPDIIVSCGSKLAAVNRMLTIENQSKSIVIMKPGLLGIKKFDLAIIPQHDNPGFGKNIVATQGALNLVNEEYLLEQSEKLKNSSQLSALSSKQNIGLLIGGDTKYFQLSREIVSEVIKQIKAAAQSLGAGILVTTSRRTSREIETLIKEELGNSSSCKLMVIANDLNFPEAVGGILGLSSMIVTSPESISMISEAVSSKKYVLVFQAEGLSAKHRSFLNRFRENKYIYLTEPADLSKKINDIWINKPEIFELKDNILVKEALAKIL